MFLFMAHTFCSSWTNEVLCLFLSVGFLDQKYDLQTGYYFQRLPYAV